MSAGALYIDNNGRTACRAHGGAYLAEALRRRPTAAVVDTPLTTWVRAPVGPETAALRCERCAADR